MRLKEILDRFLDKISNIFYSILDFFIELGFWANVFNVWILTMLIFICVMLYAIATKDYLADVYFINPNGEMVLTYENITSIQHVNSTSYITTFDNKKITLQNTAIKIIVKKDTDNVGKFLRKHGIIE